MRIVARKTFQSEIKLFIGRCKAKPLYFAWSCMACESHPCKLHEHRRVIHKCLLVEYNRDLVQRTRRPKIRYIRTILVYSTKHVVVVMFSANICTSLERTICFKYCILLAKFFIIASFQGDIPLICSNVVFFLLKMDGARLYCST